MNMQDGLQTKLDNDFYVGNLATDLVDYTLKNGNCHDLISSIDTYVQKELFNIGYKMIFKKSKKKERVVITCLEP